MIEQILAAYYEAVLDTDRDAALQVIHDAVTEGVTPEDIVFKVVIPAMNRTMKAVAGGHDVNLAQHYMTAQISSEVVDEMITRFEEKQSATGCVVIGTAEGDLHTLGKRIVTGCLKTMMIEVFDLGVNVAPERFVAAAIEHDAQVIGISAMMAHTAKGETGCRMVRQILRERGLEGRFKIIVGGAPYLFDSELYKRVGADAWSPDGIQAGKIIAALIKEVQS